MPRKPGQEATDRIAELEAAIAKHRDEKGHDRCWLDDETLYRVLGDSDSPAETTLPGKCEFITNCEKFWKDRQKPNERAPFKMIPISEALREEIKKVKECLGTE